MHPWGKHIPCHSRFTLPDRRMRGRDRYHPLPHDPLETHGCKGMMYSSKKPDVLVKSHILAPSRKERKDNQMI